MEEKKTRGNKKLLVVLAMLFLLIAIFALGGYTFAKYITSQSTGTQQATVAKWGFVVNVNANDLFSEQYKGEGVHATRDEAGVNVQVETAGTAAKNNLVAPGTKGEMTFSVTGKAEVLAKIAASIDTTTTGAFSEVKLTGGDIAADGYMPVKWTLKDSSDGTTYTDVTDCVGVSLATIATKLSTSSSAEIAINTEVNKYYKLSWEWVFEAGSTPDEKEKNNKYDTILGYAAKGAGNHGIYTVNAAASDGSIEVVDNTDSSKPVSYKAVINTKFDLKISVEQSKGTTGA